ncbi:MAG TPA: ABC transporter ATP-binding protein [Candidatus Sulfotelmatobacter sp.]|nr:ABC transporter ATP-binding protein [Candidatus Sulfotelmatobacter sp.]
MKERLEMNTPTIIVEHLAKKYEDVNAVEDLSLQIEKGELFGLLGPNGAGKTTTINVLCGLIKPTSGTVKINDFDVQKETMKVKELIGVCPQETAIYPYLTGAENVELFGNLHCMTRENIKARQNMLLEKLGLTQEARRKTEKYSGGMKRRLSLILALIHNPEIAFLDEPTVAMDPQSRHAVWDFIKELKKEDKTIILTTHYMEEAENLCDRVGIVDHGKLIALGSPKDLISKEKVNNLEEVFIKLTGRRIREEV